MMSQCFVAGCSTILPTFSPSEFVVDQWIEALPKRERSFNQHVDSVCSAHFDKKLLIQEPVYILGGSGTKITRIKCSLKPGAIPTLFDVTISVKDEPPDNLIKECKENTKTQTDPSNVPVLNRVQIDSDPVLVTPKSEEESELESGNDETSAKLKLNSSVRQRSFATKRIRKPPSKFDSTEPLTSISNNVENIGENKQEESSLHSRPPPMSKRLDGNYSSIHQTDAKHMTLPGDGGLSSPETLVSSQPRRGRPKRLGRSSERVSSSIKKTNNVVLKNIKHSDRKSTNRTNASAFPFEESCPSNSSVQQFDERDASSQVVSIDSEGQQSRKRKCNDDTGSVISLSSFSKLAKIGPEVNALPSTEGVSQSTPSNASTSPSTLPSPRKKSLGKRKVNFSKSSGITTGKRKCFVLSCLQQCKKMFHPPKDDLILFKEWANVIPKRERELTEKDCICADHFTEGSIKKQVLTAKGTYFTLPFLRWRLLPRAIPQLFRTPKISLQRINTRDTTANNETNVVIVPNNKMENVSVQQTKKKSGLAESTKKSHSLMPTQRCVVPGCLGIKDKSSKKDYSLLFHEFPLFINYRNLWAREISRKTGIEIPSTAAFLAGKMVCSLHFESKDYVGSSRNNPLRSAAVPSRFNVVEKEAPKSDVVVSVPVPMDSVSVNLDKDDSSDLEITFVQTSCVQKRNSRAVDRRSCRDKGKNFAPIKVEDDHSYISVPKRIPTILKSSRKRTNMNIEDAVVPVTTISTNSKLSVIKGSSTKNVTKRKSVLVENENVMENSSTILPTCVALKNNNCVTSNTTVASTLNVHHTVPYIRTSVVNQTPTSVVSVIDANSILNTSTTNNKPKTGIAIPKIVFESSPLSATTTIHEVPLTPITLVNSQSLPTNKQKKNLAVLPKASKYVVSSKEGKTYVSPYNEMNQPKITKTIFTPNQGEITFSCPKEDELFLVVVLNWESKKTSFSCNRDNTYFTVKNEQLTDLMLKITDVPHDDDGIKIATVKNPKTRQRKNSSDPATTRTDDIKDSDIDYNNAVAQMQNFCREAQATERSWQPKGKKKSTAEKEPTSNVNKNPCKPALVIPTLFLDSTKHGLEQILEWKSIIKLPDNDAWSVKLLTDSRKSSLGKFIFISEVVVRDGNLVLQRVLKIRPDFTFEVLVNGSDFTSMFNEESDKIKSYPRLQEIIDDFSLFNICSGLEGFSYVPESALKGKGKKRGDVWFSDKCDILCVENICSVCLSLLEALIGQRNKVKSSMGSPLGSPSPAPVNSTSVASPAMVPTEQISSAPESPSPQLVQKAPLTQPCVKTVISPTIDSFKSSSLTTTTLTTTATTTRNNFGNNSQVKSNPVGSVVIPQPTVSVPGKTKFVVHHHAQTFTPPGRQASTPVLGTTVGQPSTPVLRIPVPEKPSIIRIPAQGVQQQTPVIQPSLSAQTPTIIYGSSQQFVCGNEVYPTPQLNYLSSLRNANVTTCGIEQQQQSQREVHASTPTPANIYGNSTNAYSFSLAYTTPTSGTNSNSIQQPTVITQQKDGGSNCVVNSQPIQQQQTNAPIFYYQPLFQPASDVYGKSFQFASSLTSSPTSLGHSSQPQSIQTSYLNAFGNGSTGMLSQPKCSSLASQNTIVLSGSQQQNYTLNSSNGHNSPSEAANSVASFSVPSSMFQYYDYTQN